MTSFSVVNDAILDALAAAAAARDAAAVYAGTLVGGGAPPPGGVASGNAINPKDYGAVGDGFVLDDDAIDNAIADMISENLPMEWPAGRFRISTPKHFHGNYRNVTGQKGATTIGSNEDIPLFRIDLDADNMYFSDFSDLIFEGANNSSYGGNCGLQVVGASGNILSHGSFSNLTFLNSTYGFRNSSPPATSGGETEMKWCDFDGTQANNVGVAIAHDFGSGTGNTITGGNLVTNIAGVSYSGNGGAVVGDIIVHGVHFGGNGEGVVLSPAGSYRERVTVATCQFDAGCPVGVRATNYKGLKLVHNNYGGTTLNVLTNCTNVLSDYHSPGVITASNSKNTGAGNGAVLFTVKLGESPEDLGYNGVMVEIVTSGGVCGLGGCVGVTRALLWRSAGVSGFTVIEDASSGVGGASISHAAITVAGSTFSIPAITNQTYPGSYLFSNIRVVGSNMDVNIA